MIRLLVLAAACCLGSVAAPAWSAPPTEVAPPPEVEGLHGDFHWALVLHGVKVAWFKTVEGVGGRVKVLDGPGTVQDVVLSDAESGQQIVLSAGVVDPAFATWLSESASGRHPAELLLWLQEPTPTLPAGKQCTVQLPDVMLTEIELEGLWRGRHRVRLKLAATGGSRGDDCSVLRLQPAERSPGSSPGKAP